MEAVRRITFIMIIPVLFLILSMSVGIVYLNHRLLPDAAEKALLQVEARTGVVTSFTDIAYRFPSVVRLTKVRLAARHPELTVAIERIDLGIDIPEFLFHRNEGGWVRSASARGLIAAVAAGGDAAPSGSAGEDASSSGTLPAAATGSLSSSDPVDPGAESSDRESPLWGLVRLAAGTPLLPELLRLDSGRLRYLPVSSSAAEPLEIEITGRLNHRREESLFTFSFSGTAEGEGRIDYAKQSATASIDISALPLADWNVLLPAEYRYVTSGSMSASIDFISPLPGVAEIAGNVTGADCTLGHPSMAADPFTGIDGSFDFSATWDAEAPLPPPRILGRVTGSNPSVIARTQTELRETAPPRKGELLVRKGTAFVNGVEFEFRPALRGVFDSDTRNPWFWKAGSPERFELQLELPPVETQTLLSALPAELVGPFQGMILGGRFGWSLDLEVPLGRVAEMNWRTSSRLEDFRVDAIPAAFNVYRLDDAFAYIFPDESLGYKRMLRVPPARPVSMDWMLSVSERTVNQIRRSREFESQKGDQRPRLVQSPGLAAFGDPNGAVPDESIRYYYLEQISPWIPKAVLTAEDGDFFFHHGVNWYSFKHAVERNLKAGEIELGASTLTMQLAKNLFLNLDRAFLRKAHEAFLVFLIEHDARISKERILELYLNIAQFGPNIYGIDHASRHYFGKSPAEIDAAEAVWLATVLPSPVRYHRYYEAGAISDGWFEHMKDYMRIMVERERMSEEEYEAAAERRPDFVMTAH